MNTLRFEEEIWIKTTLKETVAKLHQTAWDKLPPFKEGMKMFNDIIKSNYEHTEKIDKDSAESVLQEKRD